MERVKMIEKVLLQEISDLRIDENLNALAIPIGHPRCMSAILDEKEIILE